MISQTFGLVIYISIQNVVLFHFIQRITKALSVSVLVPYCACKCSLLHSSNGEPFKTGLLVRRVNSCHRETDYRAIREVSDDVVKWTWCVRQALPPVLVGHADQLWSIQLIPKIDIYPAFPVPFCVPADSGKIVWTVWLRKVFTLAVIFGLSGRTKLWVKLPRFVWSPLTLAEWKDLAYVQDGPGTATARLVGLVRAS